MIEIMNKKAEFVIENVVERRPSAKALHTPPRSRKAKFDRSDGDEQLILDFHKTIHPSVLRSRQRDSFTAEREGWARSDSPSSIDRRMESPTARNQCHLEEITGIF
jgi:hypothetical protein